MKKKIKNTIKKIIKDAIKPHPKFATSEFKDWQKMAPVTKGSVGEDVVECMMVDVGCIVGKRENEQHDRIIDFKKVEIKIAFEARRQYSFTFYGYDPILDPHYWLLAFVMPSAVMVIKMDRRSLAGMHLKRSRNNTLFHTTPEDCLFFGGEVVAEYYVGAS